MFQTLLPKPWISPDIWRIWQLASPSNRLRSIFSHILEGRPILLGVAKLTQALSGRSVWLILTEYIYKNLVLMCGSRFWVKVGFWCRKLPNLVSKTMDFPDLARSFGWDLDFLDFHDFGGSTDSARSCCSVLNPLRHSQDVLWLCG